MIRNFSYALLKCLLCQFHCVFIFIIERKARSMYLHIYQNFALSSMVTYFELCFIYWENIDQIYFFLSVIIVTHFTVTNITENIDIFLK